MRIAEEEDEEGAEREKRYRENPRDSGARNEREGQRAANERQAGGIQTQPLTLLTVTPQDVFHPVFQLQLTLLEIDFFELFGFGEVMLGGQLMQAIVERVMLSDQLAEFLIGAKQHFREILRLRIHTPPPWSCEGERTTTVRVIQGHL